MGRLVLVVCTTLLASLSVYSAEQSGPANAQVLLQQALDLWNSKDYNGAVATIDRAIDAAPQDVQLRLRRTAFFFEILEKTPDGKAEQKQWARGRLRQDLLFLVQLDPDSRAAGIARDQLRILDGRELFPEPPIDCPPEAIEHLDRGALEYQADRPDAALKQYRLATDRCPTSGRVWAHFAEAYYQAGDYAMAKELFNKALALDPWRRSTHRFLADAEAHLDHRDVAVREAALAVISDPTYEAGWAAFRDFALTTGREWRRVYGEKPPVVRKPGADGKEAISIEMPPPPDGKDKSGAAASDTPDPEFAMWMSYGMAKALVLTGEEITDQGKASFDPSKLSPLEIERKTVRAALRIHRDLSSGEAPITSRFWNMMDRADRAGFSDEAIFLHLLDETLVPEYRTYREANKTRLHDYLLTVVAPASSPTKPVAGDPPASAASAANAAPANPGIVVLRGLELCGPAGAAEERLAPRDEKDRSAWLKQIENTKPDDTGLTELILTKRDILPELGCGAPKLLSLQKYDGRLLAISLLWKHPALAQEDLLKNLKRLFPKLEARAPKKDEVIAKTSLSGGKQTYVLWNGRADSLLIRFECVDLLTSYLQTRKEKTGEGLISVFRLYDDLKVDVSLPPEAAPRTNLR